jgi:hypothetical protein
MPHIVENQARYAKRTDDECIQKGSVGVVRGNVELIDFGKCGRERADDIGLETHDGDVEYV